MNPHFLRTPLTTLTIAGVIAVVLPELASQAQMSGRTSPAADAPPAWAYPTTIPGTDAPSGKSDARQHVPNSSVALTLAQTVDRFAAPDWHPSEHPVMPPVVAVGRRPSVFACGYCHLPNGAGRAENAALAGLPTSYIEEQVADFKSGARKGSVPAMTGLMATVAKGVNDEEIKEAAEYFSKLKPPPDWIHVVKATVVPKTQVIPINVLVAVDGTATEPLGNRVIEVPVHKERTIVRDSTAGYVAYVPEKSLARGRDLVLSGGAGKTIACTTCHGPDLRGVGGIPPLAGRSPSYLFRQLFDIKTGTRGGPMTPLMKAPVANLTNDDMIAIVAYLASLPD